MFHHTQNLSSPTMDWTRMSCVRSAVLITGLPGKELHFLRESWFSSEFFWTCCIIGIWTSLRLSRALSLQRIFDSVIYYIS